MKIEKFCDNEALINIFNNGLKDQDGELLLIFAESKLADQSGRRSDFFGLNFASNIIEVKNPIILFSFLPEEFFVSSDKADKFNAFMAKKGCGFLQLPFGPEQILSKYNELLNTEKEEDLLAIEINRINTFETEMAKIQHSSYRSVGVSSDRDKEIVVKAVSEARKLGLSGSDEEIINQIINFKRQPKNSIFAGKFFPGVFCDLEGTLLKDGIVDNIMLELLRNFSKEKPITLWTGGDVQELKKILIRNNITWKLVSKYDLAGAEVEMAYDNEDFSVFFEKYAIKVRNFNKV
jgi:hypothetical protein